MPIVMPNALLSRALEKIGVDVPNQHRESLRYLVHLLTGEPPPAECTVDDLARCVLLFTEDIANGNRGFEEPCIQGPYLH